MKKVKRNDSKIKQAKRVKRAKKLKQQQSKKMNQVQSDTEYSFANWEDFDKLHAEAAKALIYNATIIKHLLQDQDVLKSLESSPGGSRLLTAVSNLTTSLTKQLGEIKELHADKTGKVDLDSGDLEAVFNIHERYTQFTETVTNEYYYAVNILKDLQSGPMAILTEEETESLQAKAMEIEARAQNTEDAPLMLTQDTPNE